MKSRWKLVTFLGLILLLVSLVVGCLQPSVSALPIITEFRANPTEIASGESATLFWIVSGTTTVTIDQGIGDVPETGTQLVSPTTTTTYILRAINDAGRVTKAVVITVIPPIESNGDEEYQLPSVEGNGDEEYQPPPTPARFNVTDLSISPSEVKVGELVNVSCYVLNSGGTSGTYAIVVKSNGTEVTTRHVNLDAGERWRFTLPIRPKSVGTYIIEIDDLEATYTVVEAQVIKDLAYIQALSFSYSDDADPEPEGISVYIQFYDSKSETIKFQGIPVTVTIKLYSDQNRELVYRDEVTIRSTGEFLGAKIEIPFKDIKIDESKYSKYGSMEVKVTTPKQGSFRDTCGFVQLYSE